MPRYVRIERLPDGRFGVFGQRGDLIQSHDTEAEAMRAITPGGRSIPTRTTADIGAAQAAWDAELLRRYLSDLPLSKTDAKQARRLIRRKA